jgi:hypothetical protein
MKRISDTERRRIVSTTTNGFEKIMVNIEINRKIIHLKYQGLLIFIIFYVPP